ncbi:MAG: DUF4386 domain-containing protein [Methanobacterium sp.]|jgi:hypothetical protein|nr:DUF4386 domain-containing protein [Methanobacterium sp.]
MDSYRKTGIIVGLLFIVATVASILGSVALGSILDASNYLSSVSAHGNQMIIAVLLFLIAAISAVATSFMLFPILRRHIESLAMGYVVLRTFENVFYVVGTLSLLIILTLSQKYVTGAVDASYYQVLGTLMSALHDWAVLIGTLIFFGLGSLTLNYVLYQSRLIPRWLSLWGLIGAALVLVYGLVGIFGLGMGLTSPFALLAMPIAAQEMVFAVWLIVKGFNPSVTASFSAKKIQN